MRKAVFRVEAVPPSLNSWSRRRPQAVAALKRDYAHWVAVGIAQARHRGGWDGSRFERARVVVRYHFRDHGRRDPDNYTPKFLLDAMVSAGVLADDDFDHVALVLERGPDARPEWVEVLVSEWEGDRDDAG